LVQTNSIQYIGSNILLPLTHSPRLANQEIIYILNPTDQDHKIQGKIKKMYKIPQNTIGGRLPDDFGQSVKKPRVGVYES
jgi:hypothetical protein